MNRLDKRNFSEDLSEDLQGDLRLWYREPAKRWVEALPLGNGRLGAMVFGGVKTERIQLNEDTLWSGAPRDENQDGNNPEARHLLPQVRQAVFAGNYAEADRLCQKMQGPYNESYQPLGDLLLDFPDFKDDPPPTDYLRDLDIDRAVATVRYRIGDAVFTREAFVSFPDQVVVVRLICDRPGRLSFTARLDSLHPHNTQAAGKDRLVLTGKCPKHVDPNYLPSAHPIVYDDAPDGEGMTFEVHVQALAQGGNVTSDAQGLRVAHAECVTLVLSAATSFNGFEKSPGRAGKSPAVAALPHLQMAGQRPYAALLDAHVEDHQTLFRRVDLDLGSAGAQTPAERRPQTQPTDERIRRFGDDQDPGLAALLFQYGRYLMIASSRPGTQPANLQGIWNDSIRPPWSSNWTLNINAEMNYWPVETGNLAECHAPLLDYIAELAVNGKKTAAIHYGAGGWVAHHNGDLWRQSAPVGDGHGNPVWANWPMGGAWLCQHLWEHYAFSGDKEFLSRRAWPLMKGAAQFCLDWLVEDGQGLLVTAPSVSPEIGFVTPEGQKAAVSMACTMDMAIIWDHFTNCIEATQALGVDGEFAARLKAARDRLYPPKIGVRGQLQEWFQDFQETEVHHRHVSHLFGLFPGRQLTPEGAPEWLAAAQRALEIRGDAGTGWSLGWKINLWARLRDGDHAYRLVRNLLTLVETSETNMHDGGVYLNLFDAHPPFQIDGNFGYTSGLAEMLLQSHAGEIHLLPALPKVWPNGHVRGLRARGGLTVAIDWTDGKVTTATLQATLTHPLRIRLPRGQQVAEIRHGAEIVPFQNAEDGSIYLNAQAGDGYRFIVP